MPQIDIYLIQTSATVQMPALGGELRLDAQLTPAPAPSNRVVQGTVKGPSGNPVPNALVKIFTSSLNPVAHARTNLAGHYLFNRLGPGTYTITALLFPFIPPPIQTFTLPQTGALNIDISLLPPPPNAFYSAIYGKVIDTSGHPVEGASVTVDSVDQTGQETLFAQTTTNAPGQYFTVNLPPGNYTVQASAPGYQLSSKIAVPNTGNEYVSVDPTLAVDPLQTLGTVSGLIIDASGQPIPSAFVALYLVTPLGETLIDLTRAQTNGLYLFINVAPGLTYRIKAKVISFGP